MSLKIFYKEKIYIKRNKKSSITKNSGQCYDYFEQKVCGRTEVGVGTGPTYDSPDFIGALFRVIIILHTFKEYSQARFRTDAKGKFALT